MIAILVQKFTSSVGGGERSENIRRLQEKYGNQNHDINRDTAGRMVSRYGE